MQINDKDAPDSAKIGGADVHDISFANSASSDSRSVTALGDSTNPDNIDAVIYQENGATDFYTQLQGATNLGKATVTWSIVPLKK